MPAIRKTFGTRNGTVRKNVRKPSSTKVRPSGKHVRPDWFGHDARRLQNISDLQSKFPNVPRDIIVDSIGSGKNPDQYLKSEINSLKREKILRGVGKGAGTLGKGFLTKGWFPLTIYDFLRGKPAGAGSDVVPEFTPAQQEKQKQHIASQIHSSEYADALHAASQRKSRGGKVKKKKKKTRSKPNKIMVGYTAGGKV